MTGSAPPSRVTQSRVTQQAGVAAPTPLPLDPSTEEFTGQVFDVSTSKPIAGATVLALSDNCDIYHTLASTRTDGSGHFVLRAPTHGTTWVVLAAHAPGYVPALEEHAFDAAVIPNENRDLFLAAGNKISGVVLLPDGRPASEGRVVVHTFDPQFSRVDSEGRVTSPIAEDGTFEVYSGAVSATVCADVPGYPVGASPTLEVLDRAVSDVQIRLPLGHDVLVRVSNEAGEPVCGARVNYYEYDFGEPFMSRRHLTDAQGRVVLPLTANESFVRVEHPEYAKISIRVEPWHQRHLDVLLPRARWYVFDLVDEDGAPIRRRGGHFVSLRTAAERISFCYWGDRFRSSAAPWDFGPTRIEVAGYHPLTLALPVGLGEIDLGTLSLERAQHRMIRVVDSKGTPQPATISLEPLYVFSAWPSTSATFRTGRDGRAQIEGVPREGATLRVDARGFPQHEVKILGERGADELLVTLEGGLEVTCKALLPNGSPAAGAHGTLHYGRGGAYDPDLADHFEIADANGVIRFTNVRSNVGECETRVWAPGHCFSSLRHEVERNFIDLGTFHLQVGERLLGQVVDVHNHPLEGILVELEPYHDTVPQHEVGRTQRTHSNEFGRFEFTGLHPGRHSVTARDRGIVSRDTVNVAPRTAPFVTMVMLDTVRDFGPIQHYPTWLEIALPTIAPRTALDISIESDALSVHDSPYELDSESVVRVNLSAGTRGTVLVHAPGFQPTPFSVAEGEIARVELLPSAPVITTIRIHDPSGNAIHGARISFDEWFEPWCLTDRNGEAVFELSRSTEELLVVAEGYESATVEDPLERVLRGVLEIVLQRKTRK